MEENKDINTIGIKLFGATISFQKIVAKDVTTIKVEEITECKRPEKIIPCPRCKSMETKFCYFNNYNPKQPRHFCRGCQRYWTAGGALRNVPVGAGRRKSKPPCGGLLAGLSDSYSLFDYSVMNQDDFYRDGVVEEWLVAEHGGYRRIFQAKRRRYVSNSQLC